MRNAIMITAASGIFLFGLGTLINAINKLPKKRKRVLHDYDDMEWDFPDEKRYV